MIITSKEVSKRFVREFILKGVDLTFESDNSYALLGPNGSGKSTLMQLLSGSISPTKGTITYTLNGKTLPVEQWYKHIGFAAPYLQIVEELTLVEQLRFHQKFKPFLKDLSVDDILGIVGLEKHADKQIAAFSSGMKQRVKLALAILSDVTVLLLDEPATNLDADGVAWYQGLLKDHSAGRIIIVGSNRQDEYAMCQHHVQISEFK